MTFDVFISYARRSSQAAAREVRTLLLAQGHSVFLDEREIADGEHFPKALADALLDARAVVLLADETYLQRPWCVHELRLLSAAWRAGDEDSLGHVVLALPLEGDLGHVMAQLPPALGAASWPTAAQLPRVAAAVDAILAKARQAPAGVTCLRHRLEALNDDTSRAMLQAADVPLPAAQEAPAAAPGKAGLPPPLFELQGMPATREEGFIGRANALWQLVHELVTLRTWTPSRCVVLQGLGGVGKSQLAGEYVARHARMFFPAGVVWVDVEAGAPAYAETLARVLRRLDSARVPDGSPDAAAVAQAMRQRTAPGSLLWVIDGLPEAGGAAPSRIADWCPALGHVSVLVTTRRADTLKAANATVRLGPLADDTALQLLQRPPVDARWLAPDEWREVVRWSGALPLALAVLREALVNGGISASRLRQAVQGEPAAEIDRLMDRLRGEVDDDALRGAAQTFDLAWQAVAADAALCHAAHAVALLAPVPLEEPWLEALVGSDAVGPLVRRGWLQAAAAQDGTRAYRLHRVPASLWRMKCGDFGAPYEAVLKAVDQWLDTPEPRRVPESRITLHLGVSLRHLLAGSCTFSTGFGDILGRVLTRLIALPAAHRGLRLMASEVARAFGQSEAMAQWWRAQLHAQMHELARWQGTAAVLVPWAESVTARELMAELLAHPQLEVRREAVLNAGRMAPEAFAPALLACITQDAGFDGTPWFDVCVDTPHRAQAQWPALWAGLQAPSATVRRRSVGIVGRLVAVLPQVWVQCEGIDHQALNTRLLTLALEDADAQVRHASATALGELLDGALWHQVAALAEGEVPAQQAAAQALLEPMLLARLAPRAPQAVQQRLLDDGGLKLQLTLADAAELPEGAAARLMGWIAHGPLACAQAACAVIQRHPTLLRDAVAYVEARLSEGEHAAVLALADALANQPKAYASTLWWRARVHLAAGLDEPALAALEALMVASPRFSDAWYERAVWRAAHGQVPAAVEDLLHAESLDPQEARFSAYRQALQAWLAQQQAPGADQ